MGEINFPRTAKITVRADGSGTLEWSNLRELVGLQNISGAVLKLAQQAQRDGDAVYFLNPPGDAVVQQILQGRRDEDHEVLEALNARLRELGSAPPTQ